MKNSDNPTGKDSNRRSDTKSSQPSSAKSSAGSPIDRDSLADIAATADASYRRRYRSHTEPAPKRFDFEFMQNVRRALLLLVICLAIPTILFLSNLSVVYKNFPHGPELEKMNLMQFAERSGFRLRHDLKPRLQSAFETFHLSNGFIAAESCEICSQDHNGCHRELAREAQRWMRHTFEQGPAWVPLKPLQPYLLQLAFARSYDDETLLRIIAYARLLHSPYASMDEACVKLFKFQCELLSLDQNLQVDVTTVNFAYVRTPHYSPDYLPMRLTAGRKACGLREP